MDNSVNLYDIASPPNEGETFVTLFQNGSFKIEAIRSRLTEPGIWYNQEEDEWVVLLKGEAVLEIEGNPVSLISGDSLYLPKHTPHRVLSTSEDALWLAVFNS